MRGVSLYRQRRWGDCLVIIFVVGCGWMSGGGCLPQHADPQVDVPERPSEASAAGDLGGADRQAASGASSAMIADKTNESTEESFDNEGPRERLILGDQQRFRELREAQLGRVVLVDFWATWCGPCVEQFPHTVELHQRLATQGLSVIAISMDEPDHEAVVRKFLREQRADFDTLLPPWGAGEEFLQAFEIRGDLPFYQLYDRQGKLRFSFSGSPEGLADCEPIEALDQRVAQLLSESP